MMGKVRELYPKVHKSIFRDQIVTKADLEDFKADLLLSLRSLLSEFKGQSIKKWVKSYEVKKLLGISTGTLQTLRNSGRLPFTKIGGTIYYSSEDIDNMLVTMEKRLRPVKMHHR